MEGQLRQVELELQVRQVYPQVSHCCTILLSYMPFTQMQYLPLLSNILPIVLLQLRHALNDEHVAQLYWHFAHITVLLSKYELKQLHVPFDATCVRKSRLELQDRQSVGSEDGLHV